LPDRAAGRLADAGERLRQDVVQVRAVLEPLPEPVRPGGQLGVGELLDLGLEGVDEADDLLEPLDLAALADLTELLDDHALTSGGTG